MQNFRHVAQQLNLLLNKNTINLCFVALFEENIAEKSYWKFELEAEILHGAYPITSELVCKISLILPQNLAFYGQKTPNICNF